METFTYTFKLQNGQRHVFRVDADGWREDEPIGYSRVPSWGALEFKQCANCPLSRKDCCYCPAAVDIAEAANTFRDILSYERAIVEVKSPRRTITAEVDVQTGLSALFGLIMARSHCPILRRLRPLTEDHLPFASLEETLKRVVGSYLIKQYFTQEKGGGFPDWELRNLEALYRELETVNTSLMERLKQASLADANLNAISMFLALCTSVSMSFRFALDEVKPSLRAAF